MSSHNTVNVWRLGWRVSQHEPRSFWSGYLLFVLFFTFPVLSGWLLGRGFNALSTGHNSTVYWIAVALVIVEIARMSTIHVGALMWTRAWVHMQSLLRANLLTAQVASGGPEAGQPVGSAGEAITHFRDDVEDVTMFIDGFVDISAGVVFTVLAGLVLGSVDSRAALVLLIPLVGVAMATRTLDGRIKRYRAADRLASAAVGGMLGDVMASATTIKVNNAIEPTIAHLKKLVDARRQTAVRDRVLDESVWAFSQGAADVGLGLVLLSTAGAMASGAFSVGELAVFSAYLGWLSFLPRMVGRMLARRKQVAVAFDRMRVLVADADVTNTVTDRELPIGIRQTRTRPSARRPDRVPLDVLDVSHLTATYATGAGVHDVDFSVRRGSFTVLTGPIGSGKSTLLRALLGLAQHATVTGEVAWNGQMLGDRAAFLIPPNAAFLPQVPQLISDSVADNIALGIVDDEHLALALTTGRVAAFTVVEL